MNKDARPDTEPHRSLQILDELARDGSLTQRDLSSRLGIALGRYAYYLTPKGFAEKSRLAYDLLADYTRVYREARKNLKQLFHELQQEGVRKVVFAGADEVAEIAYITLQETTMELAGIVDNDPASRQFFGKPVHRIDEIGSLRFDRIVITSYLRREAIYRALLDRGIRRKFMRPLFNHSGGRQTL